MRSEIKEADDFASVFMISPEIVVFQEDIGQYIEMIGSSQFFNEPEFRLHFRMPLEIKVDDFLAYIAENSGLEKDQLAAFRCVTQNRGK